MLPQALRGPEGPGWGHALTALKIPGFKHVSFRFQCVPAFFSNTSVFRPCLGCHLLCLPQCYSHGCVIRCPESSSAALNALVGSSERLLFPQALKLNSVQAAGQADLLQLKQDPRGSKQTKKLSRNRAINFIIVRDGCCRTGYGLAVQSLLARWLSFCPNQGG